MFKRKIEAILRRRFFLLVASFTCLYYLNNFFQPVQFIFVHQNVNTTCTLPDLNPFDSSIRKFIYHPKPISCDLIPSLVFIDYTGVLRLNISLKDRLKLSNLECSYRIIERNGENDVSFLPEIQFKPPVYIPADLIQVICKTESGVVVDRILFNIESKTVLKNKSVIKDSKETLNLFIFGYDSVSRLAAERKLPKTMNFINKKLNGSTLQGYTMIGGNTYPNLIAVLTGKQSSSSELPSLNLKSEFTDPYPFIWKECSKRGYVTMYSEDYPEISIFANNMKGFGDPPADHYLRPYYIAQKKVSPVQTNIEMFKVLMYLENHNIKLGKYSPLCYKDRPKHVLHMEHYKQFISTYKHYAKFSFSWLTEISHEFMNFLELVDDDTMNFFKWLQEYGHLQNSVLIFMSDHGPRNEEIRNTAIGRIEERMPLLSIVLPEHLKQKHPHLEKNLEENTHRLTSPYDLHETLMDIVNSDFNEKHKITSRPYPRGISLFRNIPKDRTCADASIAEHFCACYTARNVSVNENTVKILSEFAVNSVNEKLAEVKDKCSKLSLFKIIEAQKIESGLENHAEFGRTSVLNFFYSPEKQTEQRYLILLQTSPGLALFEATVRFTDISDRSSMKLLGDVSRTNKYRNQSHCVGYQKLKPICYCKDQIQ